MVLSVVVPVYNAEKTIDRCLNSIINQDISDYEIIVVNDGSTDNSLDIVDVFVKKCSKIKLINQKNAGAAMARKAGIDAAKGKYIGFVDADDWIEKNMYSNMLRLVEESDADIVCCSYFDEEQIHSQKVSNKNVISSKEAFFELNNWNAVFPFLWNKVFKKELFDGLFYPSESIVGEDYTILLQILEKGKKVALTNYLGYHYTYNDVSVGRGEYKKATEKGFYNYLRILNIVYKKYPPSIRRSIDNFMSFEFLWMIIAMGEKGEYCFQKVIWIRKYIFRRLKNIIFNKNNSLLFKLSAIVVCFDHRPLAPVFKLYKRYIRKL